MNSKMILIFGLLFGVYFIKSSDTSSISIGIIIDEMCNKFQNFENLINSRNIDIDEICEISVTKHRFIVIKVQKRYHIEVYWVLFKKEGKVKIATSIIRVPIYLRKYKILNRFF